MRVDGLSGVVRFERVCLPLAGGLYEQPARDMEALEVLEATATVVAYEQMKERRAKAKREKGPPRSRPR